MKRYMKLYLKFLQQYIKTLIEYRADFILGLVGFVLVQFVGVIFIQLIFNSIPSLQGWSFYEILFIYGFAQIPRGIDHVFTDYLWIFSWKTIVQGEFDKYLVRPLNPLFQVISERFQPDGFGEIIIGTTLLIVSWIKLGIEVTISKLLILIIVILFATLIYTAIKLAVTSLAFWVKFAQSYMFMAYQLSSFVKYPITIYPTAIRFIITFLIPFAFTGYYPAAYFLGREGFIKGILLTCIIAIVSFIIAYRIWVIGISKYESTGS
ncbi:ABC-2 family transporter protein [Clostridium gasigenes]|uniref:ABC transporter permease n=1 Tax=Clostridium gasigenes TaxID=94869 RepID=UPI001438432D|nr:ABC-2 family transporter protein [Clostridium gasigenes]NKF05836.1 multidrug ABC transporter permease [Clostridium gasigenes]QSW19431.1 ABC-2 family transporter protein [Clostridium gasigenes]